jgi:hypothetical protein
MAEGSRQLPYGVDFREDLPSRPRYRKNPPTSRITAIKYEPWYVLLTKGKMSQTMPNKIAITPTIFM